MMPNEAEARGFFNEGRIVLGMLAGRQSEVFDQTALETCSTFLDEWERVCLESIKMTSGGGTHAVAHAGASASLGARVIRADGSVEEPFNALAPAGLKVRARVIRADGSVEDHGIIAESRQNGSK